MGGHNVKVRYHLIRLSQGFRGPIGDHLNNSKVREIKLQLGVHWVKVKKHCFRSTPIITN